MFSFECAQISYSFILSTQKLQGATNWDLFVNYQVNRQCLHWGRHLFLFTLCKCEISFLFTGYKCTWVQRASQNDSHSSRNGAWSTEDTHATPHGVLIWFDNHWNIILLRGLTCTCTCKCKQGLLKIAERWERQESKITLHWIYMYAFSSFHCYVFINAFLL